jgi:hypothetical protein
MQQGAKLPRRDGYITEEDAENNQTARSKLQRNHKHQTPIFQLKKAASDYEAAEC